MAADERAARALHRKFNYEIAGEPAPTPADEAHWSVALEPGDKLIRFTDIDEEGPAGVPIEKSAAQWVTMFPEPQMLATSAM